MRNRYEVDESAGVAFVLATGFAIATTYRLTDLGTLGGTLSNGVAINDSGQVTGYSSTADDEEFHAFLWNGTTMQDLGTLGGTSSQGAAINASGQVTGQSSTANLENHAFLWDGTTLQKLDALVDPADPLQPYVHLMDGVDINDRGQILATGVDRRTSGETHAYLVSPVQVTLPDARAQLEALLDFVDSLNIKAGISNALTHKLQNALKAVKGGHQQDNPSAAGILRAFIRSVEAQRGKALATAQADQLVSAAGDVIDAL
jgi:probable HAF family extracellular repeat protein